ncbi:MAG: hypothetical protein SFY95_10515 [Planctomycetota bacterium]|nr:hypothetical protein [Planctomycetota bacterium]
MSAFGQTSTWMGGAGNWSDTTKWDNAVAPGTSAGGSRESALISGLGAKAELDIDVKMALIRVRDSAELRANKRKITRIDAGSALENNKGTVELTDCTLDVSLVTRGDGGLTKLLRTTTFTGAAIDIGNATTVRLDTDAGNAAATLKLDGREIINNGSLEVLNGSTIEQTGGRFVQDSGTFKTGGRYFGKNVRFFYSNGTIDGLVQLDGRGANPGDESILELNTEKALQVRFTGDRNILRLGMATRIGPNQTLTVRGDTTSRGVLTFGAETSANETLVNAGTINLDGWAPAGQSARAAWLILNGTVATLVNEGTINALKPVTKPGDTPVNSLITGNTQNKGTIVVGAGADLRFRARKDTATINAKGGKILLGAGTEGATLIFRQDRTTPNGPIDPGFFENAGLLKGNGKVFGTVTNQGRRVGPEALSGKIDIGNSIGAIEIEGDFINEGLAGDADAQGSLLVELDFSQPGSPLVDRLDVIGIASILGGRVDVGVLDASFLDASRIGERYLFLSAITLSGPGFNDLVAPIINNVSFELQYDYNAGAVYLAVVNAIPSPAGAGLLLGAGLLASKRRR